MAKGKGTSEGESVMGYFKRVFKENPRWLKERSNHQVQEQYRRDHNLGPNDVISEKVKSGLANAKTLLKRKRRGKRRAAEAQAGPATLAFKKTGRGTTRSTLDSLEEQIDECMIQAKKLDPEGLNEVIHMLRRARNKVVLIGGEA